MKTKLFLAASVTVVLLSACQKNKDTADDENNLLPVLRYEFANTLNDQSGIQAIKFSAIDYLLKPVDKDELQKSLEKATANINKTDLTRQLAIMMQQLNIKPEPERKIVLNDKQTTYFIKLNDILYCEAEGPYTKFHINGMPAILVSKNLKEFEEMLEPMGFLRTHHSYIVNPDKIKLYDKPYGGELVLEGGHNIPVSKRRKEFVMDILTHKNNHL